MEGGFQLSVDGLLLTVVSTTDYSNPSLHPDPQHPESNGQDASHYGGWYVVAHRMADPSKFIVKEGSVRDNDSSNSTTTTTHTAVSLQLDNGPGQYAVAVFKMASDRTITGKPLLVEVVEVQPFTVVPLPSTTSGNILI